MEELQEALRGKSDYRLPRSSMLSVRGCDFSSDSLDDQALRDEGSPSQRDSSTMISEFSSTRTLMNIEDETRRGFEEAAATISRPREFYLSKRYSEESVLDEIDTQASVSKNERSVGKQKQSSKLVKTSGEGSKPIQKEMTGKEKLRSKVTIKTESRDKQPLRKRAVEKPKTAGRQSSPLRSLHSRTPEEKSKTSPSPRPKRDSSGNIIPSPASSASSPAKRSKQAEPRSSVVIIGRDHSKSPSSVVKSTRDRLSKSQSPSPTRAKRPRTGSSREASQSPSPTRRRPVTPSRMDSPSPTGSKDRGRTAPQRENLDERNFDRMNMKKKKMKIVLDFDEIPPPKSERTMRSSSEECEKVEVRKGHLGFAEAPPAKFYLSPIEENSEASSTSSRSKLDTQYARVIAEEKLDDRENLLEETEEYYPSSRKYHTYPKSRIPVLKRSSERRFKNLMDPRLYPLEPREIDFEAYQQLHTADSQEELQEFLLLESQCSGTLGLAAHASSSGMFYCDELSDDERGTMSGTVFVGSTNSNAVFTSWLRNHFFTIFHG